jgi:hypothetical protein
VLTTLHLTYASAAKRHRPGINFTSKIHGTFLQATALPWLRCRLASHLLHVLNVLTNDSNYMWCLLTALTQRYLERRLCTEESGGLTRWNVHRSTNGTCTAALMGRAQQH